MELTQEYLKSIFHYCPESGNLTRLKKTSKKSMVGEIAGHAPKSKDCYKRIGVLSRHYSQHRIIFMMMYGRMPIEVDHINGDRQDNRLINLREVDRSGNNRNKAIAKNNSSGVTGVTFRKGRGTWLAQIYKNEKRVVLGTFHDWFEAVCCRKSAENRYGYHPNHSR